MRGPVPAWGEPGYRERFPHPRRPLAGRSRAAPGGVPDAGRPQPRPPGPLGGPRLPPPSHSGGRHAGTEASGPTAGLRPRAYARLCSALPSAAAYWWLRLRPNFQATVSQRPHGWGGPVPPPPASAGEAPPLVRVRERGLPVAATPRAARSGRQWHRHGTHGLRGRRHPGWATSLLWASLPASVKRGREPAFKAVPRVSPSCKPGPRGPDRV